MLKDWKWITPPVQSFAGLPVITNLDNLEADIVILGLHYISPYSQGNSSQTIQNMAEPAPDAIRRQSSIFTDHLNHYDFDFNDTLLADQEIQIVDCGDIDRQVSGSVQQPEHITTAIRTLLDKEAVPIAIGTDEESTLPSGHTTAINHFVWYTSMPISIGVTSAMVCGMATVALCGGHLKCPGFDSWRK